MGLFKRKLTPEQEAAQAAEDQREIESQLQSQPSFVFPDAGVLQHASRDGSPVSPPNPPYCFDGDGHPVSPDGETLLGRWKLNHYPAPTLFGVYVVPGDQGGEHRVGPLAKMAFEVLLTDKYLRLADFDGDVAGWGQLSYWHKAGLHICWPLEALGWLETAKQGFAIGTFAVKATMPDGEMVLPYLTAREIKRCDEQWKTQGGDDRQGFLETLARARCALPGAIDESSVVRRVGAALGSSSPQQVIFDTGDVGEEKPSREVWAAWE